MTVGSDVRGLLERFARLAALAAGADGAVVETSWGMASWGDADLPVLAVASLGAGLVRVLGQSTLTPGQDAALADVVMLIDAALEQERRLGMLIEVTGRAARSDRMLRMVTEAPSCEDALSGLLAELCVHHGAVVGRIWRITMPDGAMQEVSRFADDPAQERSYYRWVPAQPLRRHNSMTANSILTNTPSAVIYSTITDQTRYALLQAAVEAGVRSQVSFPVWLQDLRFGVALGFPTERTDLDVVIADIASLANTIRPALFRKATEDRMRFMAHHDDLTRLSTRAVFNDALQTALDEAKTGKSGLALLYLDLDGFKIVNDTRGHEVGDKLLAAVAGRLRNSVREGDMVARIGGDEFAIIQPDAGQPYAATQLARRLLQTVAAPFDIDGQVSVIGVSIGIALFPSDGETSDVLQRNADAALYEVKQSGRNNFRLFERSLGAVKQERLLIERDLKDAIERQALTLAFQPIRETKLLEVRGLEALLRWTHPTRGPLPPARFVPMAEASGLIVPLGAWTLRAACAEAATWARPLCVSVNFSPMQFRQAMLPQQVETVLRQTGLSATRLDLEVTEGVLLDDSGTVLRTMHELRELGVRITLDDFGTAYASLGYLRRFPFDRIKIDKSFVQAMCEDDSTLAIVEAILKLSDRLGLDVVAEGVETKQELAVLQGLGCGLVQGYLTGRPMGREALLRLMEAPPWPEAGLRSAV